MDQHQLTLWAAAIGAWLLTLLKGAILAGLLAARGAILDYLRGQATEMLAKGEARRVDVADTKGNMVVKAVNEIARHAAYNGSPMTSEQKEELAAAKMDAISSKIISPELRQAAIKKNVNEERTYEAEPDYEPEDTVESLDAHPVVPEPVRPVGAK